jgi:hypothetical protein
MKWTGIVKKDGAAHGILPMSVDRDAMAVLSQQVCTTLSMPACIRAAIIPIDPGVPSNERGTLSNGTKRQDGASPPLQIAVKGGLVIGGLGVELIFGSRRSQSPFPRDLTTKATLLAPGQALDFHDRSPRAKVGGDPAAWIQVRDGDGVPLTDPIYVGRLGRGPCLMDPTFACVVNAETYISPFGITALAESDLTLTGEMTFDHGISLRVILRRREGALWWGRKPDAVFDFEVVSPGTMVHFPAQPIWTGESVGALKSLIFLDGEGEPIGNEHLLKPTIALQ